MKRAIRRLLSAALGEERRDVWLGGLDYRFNRCAQKGFGGPLHGSPARWAAFDEFHRRFSFAAVVETGTFRGESTVFWGALGVPVYSCEINARHFGYAEARLRCMSNVHCYRADSREFLRRLMADRKVPEKRVFFYLDAHCFHQDPPPLLEEVDLIFRHWTESVVMIDDFQVPDDPGYMFGDLGEGKKLSVAYLDPVAHLGLTFLFPALPSSEEVGHEKAGWVVLARGTFSIDQLRGVAQLREWRRLAERSVSSAQLAGPLPINGAGSTGRHHLS